MRCLVCEEGVSASVGSSGAALVTAAKADSDLRGLVFGLTGRSTDRERAWHHRPAVLAAVVLTLTLALNIVFW